MSQDAQQFPDLLQITPLTAGFVLMFRGQSIAATTPEDAGAKVASLLAGHLTHRETGPGVRPTEPMTEPQPTSEAPGQAVPTEEAMPISVAVSYANLKNLVQRRVNGEIKNDSELWAYVVQYCPGVDEDTVFSALDDAMTDQPRETQGPDDDAIVPISMAEGKLVDLTPQSMVDDYVVDESGRILADGR